MRFRAKFEMLDYANLALLLFMLILLVSGPRHARPFLRELVAVWGLVVLLRLFTRIFIYWDVTADGLRERRLWSVQTIPWQQIESVGAWPDGKPMRGSVAVNFELPAPLSASGHVVANPARIDEFLAELREHAPQARFSVPVTGSMLNLR